MRWCRLPSVLPQMAYAQRYVPCLLMAQVTLRLKLTLSLSPRPGRGMPRDSCRSSKATRRVPRSPSKSNVQPSSSHADHVIQYEFRALQAERLVEVEAAKERYGASTVNFRVSLLEYKRLLTTKSLLHRLMLGAAAQGLQQWTGINGELLQLYSLIARLFLIRTKIAIIYYAPTIFGQIGLTGGSVGLLATGIVGVVNFVLTIPAVLFVDNVSFFGTSPREL